MPYRLLADLVVTFHVAFVAFAALGGLLVLRWPRVAWLHLPAVLWGAGIEFLGGICPLTPVENQLRARVGGPGYAGDFVEHYLMPCLYPAGLTRQLQFWLGTIVLAVNVAIYARVAWRRRRRQASRATP